MLSTHPSAACAQRGTLHLRTALLTALATVFLAGCASTSPEAGYPEARPLGEPLPAYRPASGAEAAAGAPAETAIAPSDTLALLRLTYENDPSTHTVPRFHFAPHGSENGHAEGEEHADIHPKGIRNRRSQWRYE